jgi:hypothetical protein
MVVGPRQRLGAHLGNNVVWKLWPKSEGVYLVSERMATREGRIVKVVEVVDVHIAVGETPSRCDVEVPDNFVDSQSSLDAAPLTPLSI